MSKLQLTREIVLRMVGYGGSYGVLGGAAFGSGLIFVIGLTGALVVGITTQELLMLIVIFFISLLYGAVLGLIGGIILGIVTGVVLSIITSLFTAKGRTAHTYFRLVITAMVVTCVVMAGAYKLFFVDTYFGTITDIAKFGLFLFPVLIATSLCCLAARAVSRYVAEQVKISWSQKNSTVENPAHA